MQLNEIEDNSFYEVSNEFGYVAFKCKRYITLVVRQWIDKSCINGVGQVKVLVYRSEWKNLKKIEDKERIAETLRSWQKPK